MTVEGERDDISGVGQTEAAHDLCSRFPQDKKLHHLQIGVGHYGVFNGSRFRSDIVPRIVEFMRKQPRRLMAGLLRNFRTSQAPASRSSPSPRHRRPAGHRSFPPQ